MLRQRVITSAWSISLFGLAGDQRTVHIETPARLVKVPPLRFRRSRSWAAGFTWRPPHSLFGDASDGVLLVRVFRRRSSTVASRQRLSATARVGVEAAAWHVC
jgi:hypothetical protein